MEMGLQLPHVGAGGVKQAQPVLVPTAFPPLPALFQSGASSPQPGHQGEGDRSVAQTGEGSGL